MANVISLRCPECGTEHDIEYYEHDPVPAGVGRPFFPGGVYAAVPVGKFTCFCLSDDDWVELVEQELDYRNDLFQADLPEDPHDDELISMG